MLRGPGLGLVQLGFHDPGSAYLGQLVLSLGRQHGHGPPITHSADRGLFWDVRPSELLAGQGHQARSEGTAVFPWHTDCSYEACPPRYFALQVLHADRFGGGTFSMLNAEGLIGSLASSTRDALASPEYRIKVPAEFFKGTNNIVGSLLAQPNHAAVRMRFRADIVEPLTARACDALQKVQERLEPRAGSEPPDMQMQMHCDAETLPANSILLMDNGRWLHARSQVKDSQRHLRRIRWDRCSFDNDGADSTSTTDRIEGVGRCGESVV